MHRYDLEPGAVEGGHVHDPSADPLDELYIVIEGCATLALGDGDSVELHPGDALWAPAGQWHELANFGDERLRILNIWGPPSEPLADRLRDATEGPGFRRGRC